MLLSNKVSIDENSNNNTVIQDSEIQNINIYNGSGSEMIKTLGELGQYDAIQQYVANVLSAAKKEHKLYPNFSATYNSEFNKLVSTPETDDAFKLYPRHFESTLAVNFDKYPYMNKSETPWEYAYRTQTKVELETIDYQEFLGDIKDPFPIITFEDGMVTVIGAPEFPPAVEATIISGEISIPILLRRKPCLEYGKMMFGTVPGESIFDIDITHCKGQEEINVTMVKKPVNDLSTQLQQEKLIYEMHNTKQLSITVESAELLRATFTENDLSTNMFEANPYLINYLESLLIIEKHASCKFEPIIDSVSNDDYNIALTLASSFEEKWHCIRMVFDDEIRCDYDKITENITNSLNSPSIITSAIKNIEIFLQGQRFNIGQYSIVYNDARINNINAVIKNREKKKKGILITFRPFKGKDFFYKYCKFENIHVVAQ